MRAPWRRKPEASAERPDPALDVPVVVDFGNDQQRQRYDEAVAADEQRMAEAMAKPESDWTEWDRAHARDIKMRQQRMVEDARAKQPQMLAPEPEQGPVESREQRMVRYGLGTRSAPSRPARPWW
ncbi:hypothetical protein [Streptomyces sp. AP-93]|uniref:hypothetical protein n=1 Tax=Streptomyces sp. AP-93 TaxID=2929048 RepID=UPI001FAE8C0F|nr:hypothetical protein [Streptomyces sp. AP-93]MCJ0868095.1 hypothetical protein [Streptomyces sp. AP-93]